MKEARLKNIKLLMYTFIFMNKLFVLVWEEGVIYWPALDLDIWKYL